MLFDKEHEVAPVQVHHPHCRNYTGAFVTISMLIAFLFVANLYTLSKLNTARQYENSLRSALSREIKQIKSENDDLAIKYSILEKTQRRQIGHLRSELDGAAKRLGSSTGQVLNRARSMVVSLQKEQDQQADALKEELSQKADAGDVAALTDSVSSAESDLGTTQRTMNVLAKDLGMTRSELGLIAANNHNQIQSLRQACEREYHEFTLVKNRAYHLGAIGLILKKTNTRAQSFSLNLLANDQEIRNKDRNIFEPIFFYVGGLRAPYELVITGVNSNKITGYIGVPKGAAVAENTRPGGAS
jgi:chromosome segregation ATPase